MPRKQVKKTRSEFLRDLATGLKSAAVAPDINRYIPHGKQEDFHKSEAGSRLFIGGNRSGKTVGGATEAVFYLTGKHPYRSTPSPPVRGRCISVDFINGVEKIVKPEVSKWLPLSELRGGSWSSAYDKMLRTLYLANGSFLEFMSYDQDLDKFSGTSRHFVWFDEEPPQSIYVENLMRLLDVGGDLWITMTPVEGMTWLYDDIYLAAKQSDNIKVVEVDQAENPYLNHAERDQFLSGLSPDERKARVQGKFVQIGGLVYKNFGERNIIEPFKPPVEWQWLTGMDHGLNNPTAWLWGVVNPDGDLFIWDEHYEAEKVVGYHARAVVARERSHGKTPEYRVGDPSIRNRDPITGGSIQAEYQDNGVHIALGNNDVHMGINRVAKMLEGPLIVDAEGNQIRRPKLYITRNCVNLISEMYRYRWSTWASKKSDSEKNKKEEPQKKNDHAADALRYMVASRPESADYSVPAPETSIQGTNEAVSPDGSWIDEQVKTLTKPENMDDVLGTDW